MVALNPGGHPEGAAIRSSIGLLLVGGGGATVSWGFPEAMAASQEVGRAVGTGGKGTPGLPRSHRPLYIASGLEVSNPLVIRMPGLPTGSS